MATSLEDRWKRIKADVKLSDLLTDVGGKFLVGVGLGVLLAPFLGSPACAWGLIVLGVLLSASVKGKYWVRFWS